MLAIEVLNTACCRTFPAEPHEPHTLSIDFAPDPAAGPQATAEDVVMAGIEVGSCLVSSSDAVWETRHGPIVSKTQRPQLCVDVHQVRPDPFDPNRYAYSSTFMCIVSNLLGMGSTCPLYSSKLCAATRELITKFATAGMLHPVVLPKCFARAA